MGGILNCCECGNVNVTGVSLTSMLLLKALLTFAVIFTTCPTLNSVKRRFR